MRTKLFKLSLTMMTVFGDPISADDEPTATPYRPTVSNPAALSEPGWFEFEIGVDRTRGGDDRHVDSLPYLLKYAFTPDWGILLGGDLYIRRVDQDGAASSGYGDTSVVLKYHCALSETSAVGVEAGFTSPTAKSGLGNGKTAYLLNGIVSMESDVAQFDINLGVTRLGEVADNAGRHEISWAVGASRPLADQWNLALELSGTGRHATKNTQQFLAAFSYEWSKRTVLDIGATTGLNPATPERNLFAGMTVLFEKPH